MKKSIIALLAVAAIFFTACQPSGTLEFKTYKHRDSTSTPTITYLFDAEMELPEAGDKDVLNSLRREIVTNSLGENYAGLGNKRVLRAYSDSSYAEYNRIFAEDLAAINADREFKITCETKINGAVSFENTDLINYENRMYVYSGGAHGMYRVSNYIFDLSTGERIGEDEIFNPNTYGMLQKLLVEGAGLLRADNTLPPDTDIFGNELIVPNGNIEIGENGLAYIYNPYEIAPYSYGVITIYLDNEKVLPLLNEECPVYQQIKQLTQQ